MQRLDMDIGKAKKAATALYEAFAGLGIHGRTQMPEDLMPDGMIKGSGKHVRFVTLTLSIDYQRDANALWDSARRTYEDAATQYLFDPRALHEASNHKVREDMRKHSLSKKPDKDAWIWRTVGVTFFKKWHGDPELFLAHCYWHGPTILRRLKEDAHDERSRPVNDYPFLRGDKIGPLWLRMLRDNVGISKLLNLEEVPIPVDVHVARASLCLGVVRGSFKGQLGELFPKIREGWCHSVEGQMVPERPMIALDVDEPLWHLSKYGCTKRDKTSGHCPVRDKCEMATMCVPGVVKVEKGTVEIDT